MWDYKFGKKTLASTSTKVVDKNKFKKSNKEKISMHQNLKAMK
jgi:hypothetical protein